LADDAVAPARFLQARTDIAANQIGFWGQSQGGWIAPLAASRVSEAAFAITLSGGGLSPAEQELLDSEYELSKAGYTANEVNDALAFQKLKNEIIASPTSPTSNAKWDEYARARATAKDKKWFRHPGIDVRGPERRDPFWTHMRRFYVYDPLPTLQTMNAPLLAVFGELDTPEGVKANVRAIRQILDQAGRRDYTVKGLPKRIAQPDGGSPRQSQRVCPPQTIPTGSLRNDGRLDDNTTSSACSIQALRHWLFY